MNPVTFRVVGIPRPQGSKRGFVTKRGKVAMVEMSKSLPDWRRRVASVVQGLSAQPFDGPIMLTCDFYFPRPNAHYRGKARTLRPDAPVWVTRTPDSSKLVRALEDELTGVLVHDDAQFVRIAASKAYTDEQPGVVVTLTPLANLLGVLQSPSGLTQESA